MRDDDNTGRNAFISVFGESEHLLCKWHITWAWRRKFKLVPELIQDEVMHVLLVLLNEKEEAQFNILQEGFLKRYSLVAPAFIKYYRDNYAGSVENWAMCYIAKQKQIYLLNPSIINWKPF